MAIVTSPVVPGNLTSTVGPIDTKTPVVETNNNSQVPAPEVAQAVEATKPTAEAETQLPAHVAQAIARKEKALRQRQRELESREQSFKTTQSELEAVKSWRERLSNDPLAVLNEAGIDYDTLTQAILNQGSPENVQLQKMQREILNLKKAQEEALQQNQTLQTQQYEQAKKQIRREVDSLISYDSSYEALRETGVQDAVVDLIEQTYHDDGYIMNVEDAAKEILEAVFEDGAKLVKTPAFQARYKALFQPPAPPVQQAQPQQPKQQQPSVTLSNRMVASTPKNLSAKDRKERAIRAFLGQPLD